jgi:hypothetical protein
MKKKAILVGKVTRVAKLNKPSMVEFSAEISETKIGEEFFTIGDKLNFEVNTFVSQKGPILKTMNNLAVGDKIEVEMEKSEAGKWEVAGLNHTPKRGRPAGDFLNDLEEKIAAREAKK